MIFLNQGLANKKHGLIFVITFLNSFMLSLISNWLVVQLVNISVIAVNIQSQLLLN